MVRPGKTREDQPTWHNVKQMLGVVCNTSGTRFSTGGSPPHGHRNAQARRSTTKAARVLSPDNAHRGRGAPQSPVRQQVQGRAAPLSPLQLLMQQQQQQQQQHQQHQQHLQQKGRTQVQTPRMLLSTAKSSSSSSLAPASANQQVPVSMASPRLDNFDATNTRMQVVHAQ